MSNTFDSIIGQEHIKEHLRSAIISDRISQAYLITGENMSGKEFIARIFANALVCEHPEDGYNPCGRCRSCIQATSKNNPDIITVTHDKPGTVSIDDVRKQIVSDVMVRPYQSKRKIYIMNEAEKMNHQAQNALLKTLEEPPEYAVIILLATSASTLLSTILSRCIRLDMKPVEDRLIRQYLMKEVRIPDYRADICTAFARGNIGRAKSLAASEDFDNIREEAVRVLRYIRTMDTRDMIDTLAQLEKYKVSINDFLDLIMIWYRDVLMYKATMDDGVIVFAEEAEGIRKEAENHTYEGIEKILEMIEKTKKRLRANVSFELAMELMLLTIKEN